VNRSYIPFLDTFILTKYPSIEIPKGEKQNPNAPESTYIYLYGYPYILMFLKISVLYYI
jgi:hypothetical protein